MITRFYAHNFMTLVNFSVQLSDLNVIIGSNGTGKSALFSAICRVRDFLGSTGDVQAIFPPHSRNRWSGNSISEFELEMTIEGDAYTYRLAIEHAQDQRKSRVISETLHVSNLPLFEFREGIVQLYRDNHTQGPSFHSDWERSAMAIIAEGPDNKRLTSFKKSMSRIICIKPDPFRMVSLSESEISMLDISMSSVASWIRYLVQDVEVAIDIQQNLAWLMPSIASFSFADLGAGRRMLMVKAASTDGPIVLAFEELSDGQKVVFGLIAVIEYARRNNAIVLFDEPDNFVAPNIVNLWFSTLQDSTYGEQSFQAIVITHHPHIMDIMSVDVGLLFSISPAGFTSYRDIVNVDGESIGLLMGRGWVDGEG